MNCRGCGLPLEIQEEGPLCRSCLHLDRASNAFLGRSAFAEMQRRDTRPMRLGGHVDYQDRPDGPSARMESGPCAICGGQHVVGRSSICQNCQRDLEWFERTLGSDGHPMQREILSRLQTQRLTPASTPRTLRSLIELVRERIVSAVESHGSPRETAHIEMRPHPWQQPPSPMPILFEERPATDGALELMTAFLSGPIDPIQVGPTGSRVTEGSLLEVIKSRGNGELERQCKLF